MSARSPLPSLATLEVTGRQRAFALGVVVALTAMVVSAFFVREAPWPAVPAFQSITLTFVFVTDLLTAYLLFRDAWIARSLPLSVLASAYLFTSLIVVPLLLAFPGLGPFTGKPQASAWFWVAWHLGFPAFVLAYAVVGRRDVAVRTRTFRSATLGLAAGTLLLVVVVTVTVFSQPGWLPALLQSDGEHVMRGPGFGLFAVAILGVGLICWIAGTRTVATLWVDVACYALLLDILLSVTAGSRYSAGWYIARLASLVTSGVVLVALLHELGRLASNVAAARRYLERVVDGVTDALLSIDGEGCIVAVNPAACALFDRDRAALAGLGIDVLIPGFTSHQHAPDSVFETEGRTASGQTIPLEVGVGEGVLIARDITVRKRAEDAARAALDSAIHTADVRARFLATMSHEIRTPLNAIVGLSKLIVEDGIKGQALDHALALESSAETLTVVLNDVLNLSKIEAGALEIELMPFSPRDVAESILTMLAPLSAKQGLVLNLEIENGVPPTVVGDGHRLRQILVNLVSNAVKFTPAGSVRVTIEALTDRAPGEVRLHFAVIDTGIGIPKSAAARLFDPFVQAEASTQRRFGGSGLGLSICKRLVELMHGSIGFVSTEGQGSTFWFELPFSVPAETALAAPPERPESVSPNGSAGSVLVADDNAVNRMLASAQLRKLGYRVVTVDGGREAVAAAEREPFTAILMDCIMPDIDGFAATRAIRDAEKSAGGGHVPIIAMSASALDEDRDACLAAGMDSYLGKPATLDELRRVLDRCNDGQAAGTTTVA